MRRHFPRFQPDVLDENIKLVHHVEGIAKKKGVTPAQVALAWIRTMSGRNDLPQIVPIPGATVESRVLENSKELFLAEEEMEELEEILSKFEVQGARYGGPGAAHMNG
jgi:pyridoxine 4-dehydrogenase